jgi:hypothetical protein
MTKEQMRSRFSQMDFVEKPIFLFTGATYTVFTALEQAFLNARDAADMIASLTRPDGEVEFSLEAETADAPVATASAKPTAPKPKPAN